jgi:hypothetical protein
MFVLVYTAWYTQDMIAYTDCFNPSIDGINRVIV